MAERIQREDRMLEIGEYDDLLRALERNELPAIVDHKLATWTHDNKFMMLIELPMSDVPYRLTLFPYMELEEYLKTRYPDWRKR